MKLNNETKVGLLAAIAVTLLILGYKFLKGDQIFQKGFELKSYYENVDGLSVGNPVIFNGLRVGQVKSLVMDKISGKIEVSYTLENGLAIPIDSKALIYSSDLLGSKAIRIIRGKQTTLQKSGGVLEPENERKITDQVQEEILPLKDKMEELLGQMNRFMGFVNTTLDESATNKIDDILESLNKTTGSFAKASYKFDTLIGDVRVTVRRSDRIVANLTKQNDNINRIMGNIAGFSDSLVNATDDARSLIRQTENAIADVEVLVEKINSGEGTLGKLVSDNTLYDQISNTVARMDTLIEGFDKDPRIDIYHRLGTKRNLREEISAREERKLEKERRKEFRDEQKDLNRDKSGQTEEKAGDGK
ncbi:MAG: MCE family protein [Bacteroidia bacterium]|nr:MCE family protein [Bacteroidia bacterium]